MVETELKVYEELKIACIPNSISGTMFACSQVYLNYQGKISRENFLNQLNKIKNGDDKSQNLEFFINLFLDERIFKNFLEINKDTILVYGKAERENPIISTQEENYVDDELFKIE